MSKFTPLAVLMLAGSLVSAPALAQGKPQQVKPFATVNGQAIPQSVYNAFLAEQKAQGAPDSDELKEAVKEELIRRELLAQEARKKGLDKKPEVLGQMELARQAVLIRAFLADYVRSNPISDAQLKAEYDQIKASLGSTEYKARHILVEKEEEAKAIIARLDKGEKFAALAKQSLDPGSKDKGGELDWSAPNAYVPPFAEALPKLKKGEYTKTPVRTDFGFHIIQLDDSRALTPPPFEQIKPQLQQRAGQMQIERMIEGLRSKAKLN